MMQPVSPARFVRFALVAALALTAVGAYAAKEYKSGIKWPEPKVVDPGGPDEPPSDAVVLFDGTDLSQWNGGDKWKIEDGYAVSANGSISTKESFGSCQLHLEWASPVEVKGKGQGRGNSGAYLMNLYEVQILDSYENTTYFDGQAGAVYKQSPPLVNACRPPGEWQTYDIVFNAPEFDPNGSLVRPVYVTVLHNDVLIQNHTELLGPTSYTEPASYKPHAEKGPLQLQFHGNPVRFRNIWIREIGREKPVYPAGG